MIDVGDAIRTFAEVLNRSWDLVATLSAASDYPEDFVDNWLQANWEMLVESRLEYRQYLHPYYGGGEYYPDSSRIAVPPALPTHTAVIVPRGGGVARDVLNGVDVEFPPTGLPIEQLVSFTDSGYYASAPPFNHVRTGDHVEKHVFSFETVDFFVRPALPDEC